MTTKVTMYTVADNAKCEAAEEILRAKGVTEIEKLFVDHNADLRKDMWARTERHTIPQIFVNDEPLGDLDDLLDACESGEIDKILNS